MELLGLREWWYSAEKLYPGVSLDCEMSALPAAFPGNATLLKVWAPILLQHSKPDYKDTRFYVIKPESFFGMGEEEIMETLGKLAPGTGWIRVAAEAYGETFADGIEHSSRCGRGSRRLDEKIFVFWRDRLLIEPAIRPPE
jgi:hypothetical protein